MKVIFYSLIFLFLYQPIVSMEKSDSIKIRMGAKEKVISPDVWGHCGALKSLCEDELNGDSVTIPTPVPVEGVRGCIALLQKAVKHQNKSNSSIQQYVEEKYGKLLKKIVSSIVLQ